MGRLTVIVMLTLAVWWANPDLAALAQAPGDGDRSRLSSEGLEAEGKDLDNLLQSLGVKIEEVVKKYNLMAVKDIRILPFQVSYDLTGEYIEIRRHYLVKDELSNKVVMLKEKTVKFYSAGGTVSRIDTEILEKDYNSNISVQVKISDPSPTAAGTDDIVLTHVVNGRKLIDNKKLSEIKNSLAFPVRNELKRDFYAPHLSYFYSVILNIAETYNKGIKDADSQMSEFLKKSVTY